MFKLWAQSRLRRRALGLATVMIFLLVATVSAAPMAISIGPVTPSWSNTVPNNTVGLDYTSSGGEYFVRWGTPATGSGKSGYGFIGNGTSASVNPGDYYLLGTFTHYNNPIYGSPTPAFITSVQLSLSVPVCGTTQTYNYTFAHDETPNSATPCAYGSGSPGWPTSGDPNANGCADRVTLPLAPPTAIVNCAGTTYTLFLSGFYPTSGTCPSVPPTGVTISQYFYTTEQATNKACVYGRLGSPLGVTLASFEADAVNNGVQVTWETVSELRNLGFNLYRSADPDGIPTQLNDTLIPSQAPDSPMGYSYTWTDSANLVPGTTYYYWIEDVDLDGGTKRQGPVSATYIGPTAVRLADLGAASAFPAALPVAGLGLAVTAVLAAGLRRRR